MKKYTLLLAALLLHNICLADEVKIALLTELTGTNMVNGQACREGFDIARASFAPNDSVQNTKLSFIYADSKGLPAAGVTEFKKLTEVDKVDAAVVTRSQIGMAINAISRQKQVPIMGIVGHAKFIEQNPYAFRFWPTTEQEGPFLAQKAIQANHKKIALLTLEDEWTLSLTKYFKETYTRLGGAIVYDETVNDSDLDLTSMVTKIRASNPEAIFINLALGHTGALIRKIREQGLTQQIYSNFWGANNDTIETAGGNAIEGLIYSSINLEQPHFLKQLKERFGHTNATAVTFNCYAALANIVSALERRAHIKKTLYQSLKEVDTISLLDKDIKIDHQEAEFELQYKTIRNSEVTSLGKG